MPDFVKSTFSLIALLASVGFIGLCIWTKDIAALKDFVMLLMGGYGVKKGLELGKNDKNAKSELPAALVASPLAMAPRIPDAPPPSPPPTLPT